MIAKIEKVTRDPHLAFVRSTLWAINIWSFAKALFWFPLTFLMVSFIEIREFFK